MEMFTENRAPLREPLPVARRKLSWGAIVGGTFTALGVVVLLLYLGSALGLSIFNARDMAEADPAMFWASIIWLALTSINNPMVSGKSVCRVKYLMSCCLPSSKIVKSFFSRFPIMPP